VIDVSFIGLGHLAPALAAILAPERELLALIKPQFEVGREQARRTKGVISDPRLREETIEKTKAILTASGFDIVGAVDSRVHGPKGNIEHFVHAKRRLSRALVVDR
jgi:23S rRNA (cytidine1920-2'-O)/16S rRNA (cytidine1409-2'-O)-methyltransferase